MGLLECVVQMSPVRPRIGESEQRDRLAQNLGSVGDGCCVQRRGTRFRLDPPCDIFLVGRAQSRELTGRSFASRGKRLGRAIGTRALG